MLNNWVLVFLKSFKYYEYFCMKSACKILSQSLKFFFYSEVFCCKIGVKMTVSVAELLFLWLHNIILVIIIATTSYRDRGRQNQVCLKAAALTQCCFSVEEPTCESGQGLLLVFNLLGGYFHCFFLMSFWIFFFSSFSFVFCICLSSSRDSRMDWNPGRRIGTIN